MLQNYRAPFLYILSGIIIKMSEGSLEQREHDPFWEVQRNGNYIYHYCAIPSNSCSKVIVCLWKSHSPGPLCHYKGLPVIYVPVYEHLFTDWKADDEYLLLNVPCETLQERGRHVKELIRKVQASLFQRHSNAIIIKPKLVKNMDDVMIEVGVICKGFIPVGENCIPKFIEGVKTCVSQVWIEFCGMPQLKECRPVVSGCAFSPEPASHLSLDEGSPMYYGTFGGFLTFSNTTYGVTCGHCLTDENHIMYSRGTNVNQPSSFTSFLYDLHKLHVYDDFQNLGKIRGKQIALRSGLNDIVEGGNTSNESVLADLKSRSQVISVIEGGMFGPLQNDDDLWIDYGLVKLAPNSAIQPTSSFGGLLSSPSLHLDLSNGQDIIASSASTDSTFTHSLRIYGQGATSRSMCIGTLDSIEGESFVRIGIELESQQANTFHCFLSNSLSPFNKGDSGTWLWTGNWQTSEESDEATNKKIIGMGFAQATFRDREVTCILPIKDILVHSLATLQQQANEA